VPSEPLVYAHLSNTQWGTNFPQWLEGNFSWKIRLAPHAGDWRLGLTSRFTRAELSRRVLSAGGPSATLTAQPIEPGTILTPLSMRPRHDGQGVIARYSDPLGMPRSASFSLAGPVSAVWRCDLMERPVEQLELHRHEGRTRVQVFLEPHAIVTLLVEFGGDAR
jgi:hypothetical protein